MEFCISFDKFFLFSEQKPRKWYIRDIYDNLIVKMSVFAKFNEI